MILSSAISIFAGGVGSGCNPDAGKCGRPTTKLREGDKVVLTKPLRIYIEKSAKFKTVGPGTNAIVQSTSPAIGHQPEMVTVKVKGAYPERVAHDHVFLTKAVAPKIKVESVSKRSTKQQYETADGAKVTVIRPKGQKDEGGPQNLTGKQHGLYGRYKDITSSLYKVGFKGDEKKTIKIFGEDNANSKVFFARAKYDKDQMRGTTVFVHRFLGEKKAIIREFQAGQYGHLSNMKEFEYKNLGSASGMLNRRYGIRIKLKDM